MYNLGAFAPFRWAMRDKVLILTYHRFSREPNPSKISRAEFAAHLEYLSRSHNVLSLDEAVEYLQNEKTLPANSTVITIDDGYADAYEIAFPLLKKFRMPAVIYAVTDFLDRKCWLWTDLMRYVLTETASEKVEARFGEEAFESDLKGKNQRLETAGRINSRLKKMPNEEKSAKIKEIAENLKVEIPDMPTAEFAAFGWKEARAMDAENVRIESHTVTHPILTRISAKDLEFELKASKTRLEEMLSRPVENFCYPNGSFDEKVRIAAESAGYKSATTTRYGFNENEKDLYLLNRIDAVSGIANFAQSASGFEAVRQKIRV